LTLTNTWASAGIKQLQVTIRSIATCAVATIPATITIQP